MATFQTTFLRVVDVDEGTGQVTNFYQLDNLSALASGDFSVGGTVTVAYSITANFTFIGSIGNGWIGRHDGGWYRLFTNDASAPSEPATYSTAEFVICFLRGTLILTGHGEVPVEELREGDRVATRFGGLRRIAWIGTQSFDARFAGAKAAPIRFAPGSLGQGMPHSDLFVSPGHAILIQGGLAGDVLAHAAALVNGATITQPAPRGTIDYFHLDLDGHDCVLANGAWAETYFEDRNRDMFHNAADFHARFPGREPMRQETCLPILTAAHPDLPALRERLAPAPDAPHLLADGHAIALTPVGPDTWQAAIPEGTARLRLRSPTFRPPGEARTLGLMVRALALDGAPLAPEGEGWHAPEPGWTWTDGNAALPARAGLLTVQGWWPELRQAA